MSRRVGWRAEIVVRNFPASWRREKLATSRFFVAEARETRRTTSVMIPRVPSAPTNSGVRLVVEPWRY